MHDSFASADECDIVPFAQCDGFADLKFCVWFVQVERRRFTEPHEERFFRLRRGLDRFATLKLSAGTTMVTLLMARSTARSCNE